MKYKTAELEDALLDLAVALADGRKLVPEAEMGDHEKSWGEPAMLWYGPDGEVGGSMPASYYGSPSKRWEHAGPIIEREAIRIEPWTWKTADTSKVHEWIAAVKQPAPAGYGQAGKGPTPLIAAMRAYVASKLGPEVELP